MNKLITILCGIALATAVALPMLAQQAPLQPLAPAKQPAAPPAKPELMPTEIDAIGWYFDALLKYPITRLPYMRAVWIPPWGDAEWHGVIDTLVNAAASQTGVLVKADIHANGFLMIYDLERLAPDPVQLKRLILTWDELAVRDSKFHIPELNLEKSKVKAALLSPHLQAAVAKHATDGTKDERIDVLVTQLTASTGAIYPAEFFIEQIMTSVRGKYPEFIQIDFETKPFTPLQTFLKKQGFFLEQSQDAYTDKAALLIASDISGKDRVVDTVSGLFNRGPATGTFDKKDLRTRSAERFLRNIMEFNQFSDASEWFIPGKNKIPRYVLANNKGDIQRVAPPDVVADFTKPDGHTHELEMGGSCMMCHWKDSGYKLARNDFEFILQADTDFFGDDGIDITRDGKLVHLSKAQAVDIAANRFGEPIYDPDGILGRAERDFIKVVSQLTNYPVKADGPNAVQLVGAKLQSIYHGYRYTTIGADQACLELGVKVSPGQGVEVLKVLCPAPPKGQTEDAYVAFLRAGAKITRDDMDAIYIELARRAIVNRPKLFEEGVKNASVPIRSDYGTYAIAG